MTETDGADARAENRAGRAGSRAESSEKSQRRRNDDRDRQQPAHPWRTEGVPSDPPSPQKPPWGKILIGTLIGWVVLFGLFSVQDALSSRVASIPYSEFSAQVEAGNVETVFSQGESIQGTLVESAEVPEDAAGTRPGSTYTQFETERPTFAQDDLLTALEENDAVVAATPIVQERGTFLNLLFAFLPLIVIVGFYVWMFRRAQKAMSAGGNPAMGGLFGGGKKMEPVNPEDVRVTFDDVAGIDEVKAEISEVVDYLRDPEKYRALGAKLPKGVLLEGGPGTGKTLLARATAGEAGVPFFTASASEFIEMVVGVGAKRVRELFEEARKVAPAIIFIDEIDTIGRSRSGSRSMGGNDEREQTLNQILTEMDGFDGSEGVVVIAATNRADVLDDALTRPGRFDRRITVSAPDAVGREQILGVHTRGKPLAADVDLQQIALTTPGMTGADLANLANEAALLAAKRSQTTITPKDFTDALEKVQLGSERAVVMPEEERLRTAYHEAGHALAGMLRPGADPVRKISIIPRGRALGVTLSTPETDRYGYDYDYLRGRLVGALGGMAAEQEIFGVVTTGAESDLQTATNIARQMVGRWGMSEKVGPVQVYPLEGSPRDHGASEQLLATVDAEVRRLLGESFEEALQLLRDHRDKHEAIVAALMEKETLDEAEAYAAAGIERPWAEERLLVGSTRPLGRK